MAGEAVQLPVLRHGLTPGNVDQYNYEDIHAKVGAIDPDPLDRAAFIYGNAREAFAKSQSCIVDCATKLASAWSGDSADEAWRQLTELHDAASALATHSDTMQGALYATSGAIAAGKADLASTYAPSTDTTGYSAGAASPGLANRQAHMDAQARKQLAQMNSDIHNGVSKAPSNISFTVPGQPVGETPFAGQPAGSAAGGGVGSGGSGGGIKSPPSHTGLPLTPGGSHLQDGHAVGTDGMGPGGNAGRGLGAGGSPTPGVPSGSGAPYGGGSLGPSSGLLGPGGEVGKGLGSPGLGAGEPGRGSIGKGGVVGGESAAAADEGTLSSQAAGARGAAALQAGVLAGPEAAGAMGMPIMGGLAGVEGAKEHNPSSWLFEEDNVWADQGDVAPPVIE